MDFLFYLHFGVSYVEEVSKGDDNLFCINTISIPILLVEELRVFGYYANLVHLYLYVILKVLGLANECMFFGFMQF